VLLQTIAGTPLELKLSGCSRPAGQPSRRGSRIGGTGALWFSETFSNQIGRITTSGSFTEFSVPSRQPEGITSGPDGALWFTESSGNQIGWMVP
jgi:virginiamycin B lyase